MKVSICIPTYNQADYIELAVRSAIQQSFKPFEIIVSDDCSTDNTYNILDQLSKEITILKVIRQSHNVGISSNVNSCLRSANGDFIVRLDSDDQLLPNYLEKLYSLFNDYPEAGYAHCAVQEIDQNGNNLKKRYLIRDTGYKPAHQALQDAIKGYKVAANILMFRKDALIAVNYLNGRPNFGEDYHLTASISAAGFGNIYLDEIQACYRVWVDTGKIRQKRKLTEINGIRQVFEDVLEPAYKCKGWDLLPLKKRKKQFAYQQADCLGWDIFTKTEKEEIISELNKLSSSLSVKLVIWMYGKNLSGLITLFNNIKQSPKSIIKYGIKNFKLFKTGT